MNFNPSSSHLNLLASSAVGLRTVGCGQGNRFKLMVTNADGTTLVETLAQAGIVSINLKPDTTLIQYADGSAITGQASFTRADGSTGTVANDNHFIVGFAA